MTNCAHIFSLFFFLPDQFPTTEKDESTVISTSDEPKTTTSTVLPITTSSLAPNHTTTPKFVLPLASINLGDSYFLILVPTRPPQQQFQQLQLQHRQPHRKNLLKVKQNMIFIFFYLIELLRNPQHQRLNRKDF